MESVLADLKYTVVSMHRDAAFAAAALVTLALGIGATTAVCSAVYGVLIRPLPYPDADRLVRVYEEHPGAPRPPGEPPMANATMYAWRGGTGTLEGLAAHPARPAHQSRSTLSYSASYIGTMRSVQYRVTTTRRAARPMVARSPGSRSSWMP